MDTLDLRALEIFRAVAAEGSVSRAAARLNRVQSNVSTRIRRLEERLGTALFRRGARGLSLTPDGELLLSYAERLLRLSDEAAAALAGNRPAGVFRLGTMESTAAARLPAVLSRYHARYPEVRIELETDTAGGLMDRLRRHDIEAAFIAAPVTEDWARTVPVFTESLVLVAPADYPDLGAAADARALSGRTVIAFEAGCAYRRYLEQWLAESGIVPGGIMAVGSYLAILACVAAGTGYAVVPRSVLDTVAGDGRYTYTDLPGPLARIDTLLTWRADTRSAKLDALRTFLPDAP